jgi:hypothetical protein
MSHRSPLRQALDAAVADDIPQPCTSGEVREAADQLGLRMADLTVLSEQHDLFRRGTPADIRNAWFAELWRRFGFGAGVHVRRVHYRAAVDVAGQVHLPSGETYLNVGKHSDFLEDASQVARDLGLIDASLFVDRRNEETRSYAAHRCGGQASARGTGRSPRRRHARYAAGCSR